MKLIAKPALLGAALISAGTVPAAELPSALVALFETTRAPECTGRQIDLELPADGLQPTEESVGGLRHWVYPMAFNQITEGWNWHPENAQRGGDYYLFNYLPLGSREEARGAWRGEDRVGVTQEFKVRWRHDYFAGFDNLARFVAPGADDAAGFDFWLPATFQTGGARLHAELELQAPCRAQSTTFWKATHAQPEDFTLKKHYLLGHLLKLELRAGAVAYAARTRDTAAR